MTTKTRMEALLGGLEEGVVVSDVARFEEAVPGVQDRRGVEGETAEDVLGEFERGQAGGGDQVAIGDGGGVFVESGSAIVGGFKLGIAGVSAGVEQSTSGQSCGRAADGGDGDAGLEE